jgi:hypothetical protein
MPTELEILTGGVQAPDSLADAGTFTLTELSPPNKRQPRSFTASLMSAPIPSSGYGGWSRVAVPKAMAFTEWAGRDVLSITLDFLLDEFTSSMGVYVEGQCRNLERFAGVDEGDPEPPLLELSSDPEPLMPHGEYRASHNKWFVESLDWDKDRIIYNSAGNRVRAGGTLVVSVFNEDKVLSVAGRASQGSNTTKGKSGRLKTYTVKKGDTLSKIAAKKNVYGDASKWKKIAVANHIRDPKKLKVGRALKIP